MKKTLFLSAILGAALCSSAYGDWNGGNTGSITTTWAGITVNQGYYCNNNITGKTLTDTSSNAIGITPEANSTTAQIDTVTVKNGAAVYAMTNQWGNYNRAFASLTVDKLQFGDSSGTGSLNVLVYTGKEASSMTVNVKSVAGTLSAVNNAGVLTLGTEESTTALSGTIFNNGTMTLNGIVAFNTDNVDHYETKTATYYTADEQVMTSNGFAAKVNADYYAIKGGSNLTVTGTITGATQSGSDYVFNKTSELSSNVYQIITNTASADDMRTATAASVEQIVVNTAATLTLGGDTTLDRTKLNAKASTTLTGSGLYIANSAQTLGDNVTIAEDWTGTVQLTGALDANANFYQTAANENSTLEMKGVTGWFYDWYDVRSAVNANIKLTDANANTLAWVNGAFGGISNHAVSTFTGTWSGTGSFRTDVNNEREMNYTYSGNISAWTGKFIYGGKGDLSNSALTFTGSATDVNITIEKATGSKGTFTVVADADVTFSKDITANALTINANKSVDLGTGTLTLSSMTLGDGSTVKFHSAEDWAKSEVALTTGNGYGHVGISKTLGYTVTDNGATVTVDGLAATLTDNVLSSTTAEETATYYINAANQNVAINKAGESTLNAGTYSQTAKVEIGTKNASAENASAVVLSGVTSLTTGDYLEVFHNSSLELNDTAHVEVTNNTEWKGAWLHNGSSITMAEGASLTVGSLTIQGGSITGTGDAQIGAYQHQAENATITGSTITVAGTSLGGHKLVGGSVTVASNAETTINSALSATTDLTVNEGSTANFTKVGSSVKTLAGEGTVNVGENADLTVNAASTIKQLGGLGTVKALADLTVTGGEDVTTLGGLEIAGGTTVTLGTAEAHNHTLALNKLTVTGAGSTINANLNLSDATVTLNGNSVTLGCDLKFSGTTITLSDADIAIISNEEGAGLVIFNDVESLTLGTTTYTTDYIGLVEDSGLILTATSTLPENVFVNFNATDKTVSLTVVPEPATATLSLLALAALAARRKRK